MKTYAGNEGRNISEAGMAFATSREIGIKLTKVARVSLEELQD